MASTAVDGRSLASEQAQGRATEWGNNAQGWIAAHDVAVGFTGNPDELFTLSDGSTKSITQLGAELAAANYPGPWDRGSILSAYTRASGKTIGNYTPPAGTPPRQGGGGTITHVGGGSVNNGDQASQTAGTLAGAGTGLVQTLSQSVGPSGFKLPMYAWIVGGIAAYEFIGKRRR